MTPPATPSLPSPYLPRRAARSLFVPLRGLRYHVMVWGDPSMVTPETPPLVLVHGWMDVGASFQFVVDALDALGEEDIDTPAGHFRTLHLRAMTDSVTEIWLALDHHRLPVKIRFTDKKGDVFEQIATELGTS